MAVRLRHLHLNLSLPSEASSRRNEVVDRTRRELVRVALEICEREVRRQLGPRAVVRVRSLRIALDLDLGSTSTVEVLGRDLAEHVVRSARASRSWVSSGGRGLRLPSPESAVVWFEDDSEANAVACLLSGAGEARPWYADGLGSSQDPWVGAALGGAPHFEAVIGRLVRIGQLQFVLRSTPEAALRRSLEVRPVSTWPAAALEALARVHPQLLAASPNPSPRGGSEAGPSQPPKGADVRGADVRGADVRGADVRGAEPLDSAPRAGGAREGPPTTSQPSNTPMQEDLPERTSEPSRPEPATRATAPRDDRLATAPPRGRASGPEQDLVPPSGPGQPRATGLGAPLPARDAPLPIPLAPTSDPTEAPHVPDAPPPAPPGGPFAPVVYETDFAGLFFLARTFLQLEVGEHLWCAGLDERWVLRALADHLLGGVHDPAAAVFAGLDPRTAPEPRPVPAWAVVEVKEKLRNALWQFSKGALAEEIERFDVRVGPLSAWALPNPSEDLVACLAAATVLAVSHRLEVEPTHGALQRLITEAGRVVVRPEQVHVWLAMRAVRTDVRRAGLDINPGWVPWMKAKLEIVFGTDRDSSLGAV